MTLISKFIFPEIRAWIIFMWQPEVFIERIFCSGRLLWKNSQLFLTLPWPSPNLPRLTEPGLDPDFAVQKHCEKLQGVIRGITFSGHKADSQFTVPHIRSAYSTCDPANSCLCCSATSRRQEQGVNSGNRITQHVKNEFGTTAHVWCN